MSDAKNTDKTGPFWTQSGTADVNPMRYITPDLISSAESLVKATNDETEDVSDIARLVEDDRKREQMMEEAWTFNKGRISDLESDTQLIKLMNEAANRAEQEDKSLDKLSDVDNMLIGDRVRRKDLSEDAMKELCRRFMKDVKIIYEGKAQAVEDNVSPQTIVCHPVFRL